MYLHAQRYLLLHRTAPWDAAQHSAGARRRGGQAVRQRAGVVLPIELTPAAEYCARTIAWLGVVTSASTLASALAPTASASAAAAAAVTTTPFGTAWRGWLELLMHGVLGVLRHAVLPLACAHSLAYGVLDLALLLFQEAL